MVYEAIRGVVTGIQGSGATAPEVVTYITENVLQQVVDLLPLVIPVVIGFIAFRKGYAFLKSALRSA